MAVVYDNEISLRIEAGAPRFSGRTFERIAGKALPGDVGCADLGKDLMRQRDQCLRFADNVTLTNTDFQPGQTRFVGCMKRHSLIVNAFERAGSIKNFPIELYILLHATPGAIARQSTKLAAGADAKNTRCR
jgi:hypothetical protein